MVSCRPRFTTTAHSMPHPHRRHRGPKPDRRRAVELLAAYGCSESLMVANGFTAELLIELVRAGLASAHAERTVADGKMMEAARVKISYNTDQPRLRLAPRTLQPLDRRPSYCWSCHR